MTRGMVQRYTVFYHDEFRQWAMAPPGDGLRAVFGSHAEAIAYADRQARKKP